MHDETCKDMRQWQEEKHTQGRSVNDVGKGLADGFSSANEITVGEDYAFGYTCCTGGVDDSSHVVDGEVGSTLV